MKVAFYTLGCKVNQNETSAMQQLFASNGFTIATGKEIADIYVVNSCTVTAGGDKKSLQWLRHAKRINPLAITILTGCLPQAFPEKSTFLLDADIVTGAKNRISLLHNIDEFMKHGVRIVDITPHEDADTFEELPLTKLQNHTRAFVKIEDGCNNFCSYCIVPYARGRVRSRKESNILQEVTALCDNGYKEIVLTGINLACYGNDTDTDLPEIVNKIAQNPNVSRIRLSSLEPNFLTNEQLILLAKEKKLCPHFHFSLQSGCDATLSRMNRKYDTASYTKQINLLKSLFSSATFTTDIIVGFPGETDAEFEESLNYVKTCGFLKVHIFPYSPRTGTPAASLSEQISSQVSKSRLKEISAASDIMRNKVLERYKGITAFLLLEKALGRGMYLGYTEHYIPATVFAPENVKGDIVKVKLSTFEKDVFSSALL